MGDISKFEDSIKTIHIYGDYIILNIHRLQANETLCEKLTKIFKGQSGRFDGYIKYGV